MPNSRALQLLFIILLLGILLLILRYCGFGSSIEDPAPPLPDLSGSSALTSTAAGAPNPTFAPNNGCSSEAFFVDVREGAGHPGAGFRAAFQTALTDSLRQNYCRWYVPSGEEVPSGCTWDVAATRWVLSPSARASVEARVSAVFSEPRDPSSGCLVHDGHLRFFRVQFVRNGATAPAPRHALCSIQTEIRARAEAVAGATPTAPVPLCSDPTPSPRGLGPVAFDVGRECPLRTLGLTPTSAMLDWHHDQLGSLVATPDAITANDDLRPVTYLVDTGVYKDVGDSISVEGAASGERLDPHGSALAMMMREISPAVPASTGGGARTELRSENVFDKLTTTSARLARALEQIFMRHRQLDPVPPAIVNLSLGWPFLLSHPRAPRPLCGLTASTYQGGTWQFEGCTSQEGAFGGPVRFALALLRFGLGDRATAVAAPGNQPADLGIANPSASTRRQAERFIGRLDAQNNSCGGPGWSAGELSEYAPEAMFYPAYWGLTQDRHDPLQRTGVRTPLLVAAGARDHRGQRVRSTLPAVNLDFEVPGQHVYVPGNFVHPAHAALSMPSGANVRDATGAFPSGGPDSAAVLDARFALATSQAWTGTSVSAALLSASLAEAHLAYLVSRGEGSGPGVLGLLFATGVDVDGGRRPNLCRLRTALSAGGANSSCRADVEACYKSTFDKPATWMTVARTAPPCERLPSSCLRSMSACPTTGAPGPWPVGDLGTPIAIASPATTPCGTGSCLEVSSSGGIGPQPPPGLCPDCPLLLNFAPGELEVWFSIDDAFDPAFTMSTPIIHVDLPGEGTVSYELNGLGALVPGAEFYVTIPIPEVDGGGVDAALLQVDLSVSTADGEVDEVTQFADFAID